MGFQNVTRKTHRRAHIIMHTRSCGVGQGITNPPQTLPVSPGWGPRLPWYRAASHPPTATCAIRGSAWGPPGRPDSASPGHRRGREAAHDPTATGALNANAGATLRPPAAPHPPGSHPKPGRSRGTDRRGGAVPGEEVAGRQAPTPSRTARAPGTAGWGAPRRHAPLPPAPAPDCPGARVPPRPPRAPARAPARPGHSPGRAPAAGPGSGHSLRRAPSNAGAATSASAAAARHVTPGGRPPRPGPPPAASRRPCPARPAAHPDTDSAPGTVPPRPGERERAAPGHRRAGERELAGGGGVAFMERLLHSGVLRAFNKLLLITWSGLFPAEFEIVTEAALVSQHLLLPWANHLNTLGLSLPICQIGSKQFKKRRTGN